MPKIETKNAAAPKLTHATDDFSWLDIFAYPLACIGALLGSILGAVIFNFALRSGLYFITIIGFLAGIGAPLLARRRDWAIGFITGVVALSAGVWTEAWLFPWKADPSLAYFVAHIKDLPPMHLLMHALGVGAAIFLSSRK
jgi:hypothetical protein